jgi:hypothetical protein
MLHPEGVKLGRIFCLACAVISFGHSVHYATHQMPDDVRSTIVIASPASGPQINPPAASREFDSDPPQVKGEHRPGQPIAQDGGRGDAVLRPETVRARAIIHAPTVVGRPETVSARTTIPTPNEVTGDPVAADLPAAREFDSEPPTNQGTHKNPDDSAGAGGGRTVYGRAEGHLGVSDAVPATISRQFDSETPPSGIRAGTTWQVVIDTLRLLGSDHPNTLTARAKPGPWWGIRRPLGVRMANHGHPSSCLISDRLIRGS